MSDLLLPFIDAKIQEAQRKIEEKAEDEVWITDLTECPRKAEFRVKMPDYNLPTPSTIVGDFVHVGVLSWLREFYDAEIEKEITKEIDGIKVKGRVDAILEEGIVVEVKFMRASPERTALPHHIEQVRLYLWLTEKEKGIILYITPDGIYEHPINVPYTDEQVKSLLAVQEIPRYDWECQYCSWSAFCEKKVRRERK